MWRFAMFAVVNTSHRARSVVGTIISRHKTRESAARFIRDMRVIYKKYGLRTRKPNKYVIVEASRYALDLGKDRRRVMMRLPVAVQDDGVIYLGK